MTNRSRRLVQIFRVIAFSAVVLVQITPVAQAQITNGRNIVFGTVITATGCHNRFSVATKNGLSIISYIGGLPVLANDIMDGDMETVGQTVLINKTRAGKTIGFVEASQLSNAEYRAKRAFLCR